MSGSCKGNWKRKNATARKVDSTTRMEFAFSNVHMFFHNFRKNDLQKDLNNPNIFQTF
jgi:hypothetical protein